MPNSIQENHQNKIAEAYLNPLKLITQEFGFPIAFYPQKPQSLDDGDSRAEKIVRTANWGP